MVDAFRISIVLSFFKILISKNLYLVQPTGTQYFIQLDQYFFSQQPIIPYIWLFSCSASLRTWNWRTGTISSNLFFAGLCAGSKIYLSALVFLNGLSLFYLLAIPSTSCRIRLFSALVHSAIYSWSFHFQLLPWIISKTQMYDQ